jgi:hypothetical protein
MSVVLPVGPVAAGVEGKRPAVQAAVPEQIRVCIHVGDYFVDTSLAAHAPLSVVMEGLVPFLVDTLREEGLAVEFKPHAVYSLAGEGGMPHPRTMTLAEAGVLDGARLLLREVRSTEVFKPIIEDGSDALAEYNSVKFPAFSASTAHVLGLAAAAAGAALTSALFIAAWWSTPALLWWLPLALTLMVIATAGAAVVMRMAGGKVSQVRIALTNVAPTALHAEAAEAALLNKPFNAANVQAAVAAAIAICDPAEDLRGDVEYKTAMAGEMVKRALNKAWALCA